MRGVKVRMIFYGSGERQSDRASSCLIAESYPSRHRRRLRAQQLMIIDGDNVITGSFNFIKAAQKKNAENVLLIKGHPDVTATYRKNWERRLAASRPY